MAPTASRQPPVSSRCRHPGPAAGAPGGADQQVSCQPPLPARSGFGRSRTPVPPHPRRTHSAKNPRTQPLRATSLQRSAKRPWEAAPSGPRKWAPSTACPEWPALQTGKRCSPPPPPPRDLHLSCRGPTHPHARPRPSQDSAPYRSEPRPPPSPQRAGARVRGPGGAPCCARAEQGGARRPGLSGGRRKE